MKRKEETAIILSALATAGVPESNQVKSAVDYGLKLIRIRKFEERTEPKEGLPMLEKWTGDLIGKMHNSKVTYDEVAAELGCTKAYGLRRNIVRISAEPFSSLAKKPRRLCRKWRTRHEGNSCRERPHRQT